LDDRDDQRWGGLGEAFQQNGGSNTAVDASNMGCTTTEPATATEATAAAAGQRVIWDQGSKNEYDGYQNDESGLLMYLFPCLIVSTPEPGTLMRRRRHRRSLT
jgi:hypothetical protein